MINCAFSILLTSFILHYYTTHKISFGFFILLCVIIFTYSTSAVILSPNNTDSISVVVVTAFVIFSVIVFPMVLVLYVIVLVCKCFMACSYCSQNQH